MWYVYIIDKNNILYTGMTQNLSRRMQEHKNENQSMRLLYSEGLSDKFQAARREKQIKGWTRRKKIALVSGNIDLLKKL